MILAYDARPVTRDIDGIWHPSTEVRAEAKVRFFLEELLARR